MPVGHPECHSAYPQSRYEGVDLEDIHEEAVDETHARSNEKDEEHSQRPSQVLLHNESDGKDALEPHHVAHREVILSNDYYDHFRERQDCDDCAAVEDGLCGGRCGERIWER